METELTKSIKKRLRYFKPQLNTQMRTIRWAEEVSTPTGYVDVIRFEDYIAQDDSMCSLITPINRRDEIVFGRRAGSCKVAGETFPNKNCKGCVYKKAVHVLGVLTTCFEVKISVQDFRSSNGHNFCGNRNYYAVPVEIYEKIKHLIPDGIGVIGYYSESGHMVVKQECEHREIASDLLARLLYDALKKWVDRTQEAGAFKPE